MTNYDSVLDAQIEVILRTAKQVRLYIDEENGAPEFWKAVDTIKPPNTDAALLQDLHIGEPLLVTPEQARRILDWAITLPEWDADDAPEFAPHPILVQDADD